MREPSRPLNLSILVPGCSSRKLLLGAALGLVGLTASACYTATITHQVRGRASYELNCPQQRIRVHRISSSSGFGLFGARGCGRQITYRAMCNLFGTCILKAEFGSRVSATSGSVATVHDGCKYDSQCKGDRICDRGRCVSPSSRRETAPRTATRPSAPTSRCPPGTSPRSFGRQRWCVKQGLKGVPLRHGPWETLHKNGRVFVRYVYSEGKKDGPFSYWNTAGKKYREGQYKAGKKHGSWTWWQADGRKIKTCVYQHGQQVRCHNHPR